jgi:3-oxoacyl-[acyl-carrier protein] reductase
MDLGIKGKTALVLASSRGLGQAMAHSLAREGVQVAVTGRNAEGLAQTVKMIESVGGKALALNWDLADLNAIDGHVQTIENQLGPVDILINNTGGPHQHQRAVKIRSCGKKAFRKWCSPS